VSALVLDAGAFVVVGRSDPAMLALLRVALVRLARAAGSRAAVITC
jgi:hypothetical protein